MFYVYLACLVCLFNLLGCVQGVGKSMFSICDSNNDKEITKSELTTCMGIYPELDNIDSNSATKAEKLMNLIDRNNDGSISPSEFKKATEQAQDAMDIDEFMEVTRADGSKKLIHKSELFNPMSGASDLGVEMKNNKMSKEDSKTGLISELATKDHALGNMIRIAQWSASQLVEHNFSAGSLLNMESLPRGGSVVDKTALEAEPEKHGVAFKGEFELWLKLKMGNSKDDKNSNITTIEVHIDYSKARYKPPHLALLQAWVLEPQYVLQQTDIAGTVVASRKIQETRVQALALPPPRLREGFWAWIGTEVARYAQHPYAATIAVVVTALFIATIFI